MRIRPDWNNIVVNRTSIVLAASIQKELERVTGCPVRSYREPGHPNDLCFSALFPGGFATKILGMNKLAFMDTRPVSPTIREIPDGPLKTKDKIIAELERLRNDYLKHYGFEVFQGEIEEEEERVDHMAEKLSAHPFFKATIDDDDSCFLT